MDEGIFPGSPAGRQAGFPYINCISARQVHSGRKTGSQEGGAASSRSCPRPVPTIRGEDVAEHRLELPGGWQLLQGLCQALHGPEKEWREPGEQPAPAEELSHRQREGLQQDGMKGSPGCQLERKGAGGTGLISRTAVTESPFQ